MSKATQVESRVDNDVDTETTAPAPLTQPVHWPHFWNELAPDWAAVQAVLAEEVPADATPA